MKNETDHEHFDYNLDHYTLEELFDLFSLNKQSTKEEIIYNTNTLIESVKQRNQIHLLKFYKESQDKLFNHFNIDGNELNEELTHIDDDNNERLAKYYDYDIISKAGPDYTSKPTNSRYSLDYIKGDKNPVFKNNFNSLVNIDSSFKDTTSVSTTSFLSTLTHALSNVIDYSVYSIEIPYSWYFFSSSYGNTIMLVNDTLITLPDGNYTIENLISTLNNLLSTNSFNLNLSVNTVNNYITIENTDSIDYTIIFYDISNPIFSNSLTNVNLGWNLGFKIKQKKSLLVVSANSSTVADSGYYIYGPNR